MQKNIVKFFSRMGKIGGKKSAEKRLKGKTKEEISEIMRKVSKASIKKMKELPENKEDVNNL